MDKKALNRYILGILKNTRIHQRFFEIPYKHHFQKSPISINIFGQKVGPKLYYV